MNDQPQGSGGRRRRKGKRTSLATRLSVAVLLVSITSIVAAVFVTTTIVDAEATELLRERVAAHARSLRTELDSYFRSRDVGIRTLAASASTSTALEQFSAAYAQLERSSDDLSASEVALSSFYLDEFLPAISEVRGTTVDVLDFYPSDSRAAQYLQAAYIANSPFELTELAYLSDAGDGSSWSAVHREYHPALRDRAENLGFDDLFLVDAASEAIVYSTNKDTAFATSIADGPQSGTALAALARRLLATGRSQEALASDVTSYPPLLDQPSGFIGAPIMSGDEVTGAIIAAIDLDDVSQITTEAWRDGRSGETSETYLVGQDRRMRSDSRLLLEDPAAFFAAVADTGKVSELDLNRMRALGTSVVFQPVDNDSVRSALAGEAGIGEVTNYLGEKVYSAYAPIGGETVQWALLVEQTIEEAEEPQTTYVRTILTVTVVFIVLLTFVAVSWAGRFVSPIRMMGAALGKSLDDEGPQAVPVSGVAEFRALGEHLNEMVGSLKERREVVLDALRAKTAVLRALLPESALEQVQSGERQFVETVPQSSVVVVRLRGTEELVADDHVDAGHDILARMVDAIDDAAGTAGLDRIKVQGDRYFAVCGLSTPHIDHISRSVSFAREAVRAVIGVAIDHELDIRAVAGVATGSATVGLVGGSRLVFDAWGEPVDLAFDLANLARPPEVLLSADVGQRLPEHVRGSRIRIQEGEDAWAIDALADDGEMMR